MPLTEKDHQLIDDFLQNRLSDADKKRLNNRLQEADFQTELNFKKNLQAATKKSGRAHAKAQLQQFEQQRKDSKTPKNTETKVVPMRQWWLAAAMVLILLAVGIWYLQPTDSTTDLYAQYYEFYPNVVTQPIVKGENDTIPLALAFQAYELKNFKQAQQLFANLPSSYMTNFYQGIIELELGNVDQSASFFQAVTKEEKQDFFIPANYYLGLIDLKKGVKDANTINYFTRVADAVSYPYLQKKSTEILGTIGN